MALAGLTLAALTACGSPGGSGGGRSASTSPTSTSSASASRATASASPSVAFADAGALIAHLRTQARADKGMSMTLHAAADTGGVITYTGRASTTPPFGASLDILLDDKPDGAILLTRDAAFFSGGDLPDGKFAQYADEEFRNLQRTFHMDTFFDSLDYGARSMTTGEPEDAHGTMMSTFVIRVDTASFYGTTLAPGDPAELDVTLWLDPSRRLRHSLVATTQQEAIEEAYFDDWGKAQQFVAPPPDFLVPMPDSAEKAEEALGI